MKEKIYTIPVNEAFETSDGCPFCRLKNKLERERAEYTLGASMMEPDARMLTNTLGFCDKHFEMIFERPNKLSLALVLETHLDDVRRKIGCAGAGLLKEDTKKGGIFKKKENTETEALCIAIDFAVSGCAICSHVNSTMERYFDVFFYMWENDKEFRAKFDKCEGLCLPHYKDAVQKSAQYLKKDAARRFSASLYEKQCEFLDGLQEDIHKFTLKFDYRNKDMPWGSAKDAPKRVIGCLSGITVGDEDNEEENR